MPAPRVHNGDGSPTRLGKKIKRRSDVVGIFPNEAAVVRLVGALLLEQNDEWATTRRYMTLQTLSSVSDNAVISLPDMSLVTLQVESPFLRCKPTRARAQNNCARRRQASAA